MRTKIRRVVLLTLVTSFLTLVLLEGAVRLLGLAPAPSEELGFMVEDESVSFKPRPESQGRSHASQDG